MSISVREYLNTNYSKRLESNRIGLLSDIYKDSTLRKFSKLLRVSYKKLHQINEDFKADNPLMLCAWCGENPRLSDENGYCVECDEEYSE